MRSAIILGVLWAMLLALLATGGHAPSFTRFLPVPADQYYGVAALYVLPLVCALGWLFAMVARGVAGVGARDELVAAWARPTAALFVVPDLVVYAAVGFEGIGAVVRVTAPLTAIGVVWLTRRSLVIAGASGGRALGAAVLALFAQAIPAAFLLR